MNEAPGVREASFLLLFQQLRREDGAMGKCAIFLDGGYLDKIMYYDHANARIDYEKLSREMAQPDELLRAYYYHCLPYQSNPPTDDERQSGLRHKYR